MKPDVKHTIRRAIRIGIRQQNATTLFTCFDCAFYQRKKDQLPECQLNTPGCAEAFGHPNKRYDLVLSKRMPTQMPSCFILEPLRSPLANVLDTMRNLGVRWLEHDTGWPTIVSRLLARASNYGYFTGIRQRNLDKYGS
jgi:hypothetical protein